MLFLKKHAMRGADFSGVRRKDVWSIPLGILREVVINALVHADYSQRGAPTRVAFFDDRIEIENPGILLPGMTIEDMKQGVSRIRNSVIARIFRELDLIEQWGSGVRRIFKEAEEQGLPEPQIVEVGMRMRFIVPLAEPNKIQSNAKQTVGDDALQSTPRENPAIPPTQSPTQSGDSVIRLIRILSRGPLSPEELRKQLDLKHRPTFRKNYLHPALKEGYIEMTIPEKPNSRLQRYCLTQKGKALIKAQRTDDTESGERSGEV